MRSLCLGMALMMSVSWTAFAATDGATGPGQAAGGTVSGAVPSGATVTSQNAAQPTVAAQGAVLYDATHNQFLFSKNADTQYYPASITKLMTALLVAEKCSLDDTVTFSKTAVTNLESGAVTLGLVEGDKLTVRQSLYGLLLKSANEVANGLAEHTAGSISKFADMMNARAKELGCTNTNFVNPNGLNNSNHYTTPHDMALIARAAFQNGTVSKIASTLSYQIPATQKAAARTISLGHKMLYPNDARYYQGVIGGKTGYTSKAGNTLVTAVEKDGVRLIAVIMKSKSTHYTDTKALFDYGYELVKAGALSGSAGSTGSSDNAGTTGSSSGTGNAGPGTSSAKGWVQDSNGWYYVKDNGAKAANEWVTADGVSYWIDSNTYMAKGWRQVNGKWYFLRSNGAMARNQWEKVEENGQWFYLGADGAMLTNTTTPDGSRVDESGAWVQ